jgi:hypothetical protein
MHAGDREGRPVKALLLLLCAGCAAPGIGRVLGPATVYEDVSAPLEYRADALRGAREVRGEACQTGIFLPLIPASIAWGDGGYRDAVRQAQAQAPGAALTDVRADLHVLSVLTIFRKQCVVVTAATSQ